LQDRVPLNPELAFDLLESAAQAQSPCGETEIEMRHGEGELWKFGAQVRHVKTRSEKGDEQCAGIQFRLEPFRRQCFSTDETDGFSSSVQPDDRDVAVMRGGSGGFDVQIQGLRLAEFEEPPVLAAG
jgi:hypothetical protein